MTIEQAVGDRARRRRTELGLSQESVGRRLEPLLGRAWSRSTVSQAESGNRDFKAVDLLALAQVLDVAVAWPINPEPGDIGITFPTGAPVEIHDVVGVGRIAELQARTDALDAFANKVRADLDALGM